MYMLHMRPKKKRRELKGGIGLHGGWGIHVGGLETNLDSFWMGGGRRGGWGRVGGGGGVLNGVCNQISRKKIGPERSLKDNVPTRVSHVSRMKSSR